MIPPKDAKIQLDQTATFTCAASNVYDIIFVVDNVDPSNWASRGIVLSAPVFSGGFLTLHLTVLGSESNNGILITCSVYYVDGTAYVDIPPPAQLIIAGLLILIICNVVPWTVYAWSH